MDIIQRSHAIANGVYVAAVNRVGIEKQGAKKLEFWGNTQCLIQVEILLQS